jgi:hypothetical protein
MRVFIPQIVTRACTYRANPGHYEDYCKGSGQSINLCIAHGSFSQILCKNTIAPKCYACPPIPAQTSVRGAVIVSSTGAMSQGRSTNSAKDRAGLRVNGVVGLSDLSDCRVIFIPVYQHFSCQNHSQQVSDYFNRLRY